MTYLEMLKQENSLYDELPKLPKVQKGGNKPIQPTAKTAKRAFDSKDSTPNRRFSGNRFPDRCSIITGKVQDECRFHPKILSKLMNEGVLSADVPCPLLGVCKLKKTG